MLDSERNTFGGPLCQTQGKDCVRSAGDLHRPLNTLSISVPEITALPQTLLPQRCLQSFTKAKAFTFYSPGACRLEKARAQPQAHMIFRNQMTGEGTRGTAGEATSASDNGRPHGAEAVTQAQT